MIRIVYSTGVLSRVLKRQTYVDKTDPVIIGVAAYHINVLQWISCGGGSGPRIPLKVRSSF
jgi:hypothetical protein